RLCSSLHVGTHTWQGADVPVSARAVLVQAEHLSAFEEMVSVPCLFHEHLAARHIYQVVVIADQVFAAVTTASPAETEHWWSSHLAELAYEPASLPDSLLSGCRTLVQSYGLQFAVMQLALGPLGEIFFVGLDPVGNFL